MKPSSNHACAAFFIVVFLCACSADGSLKEPFGGGTAGASATRPTDPSHRFITSVVRFAPGSAAGFGQDQMPDIVYGPPQGTGALRGSLDVVSLGVGGEIVVEFAENALVDGPGVDFIVFENPFYINGNVDHPYKELGEVSVSEDGNSWAVFPCDVQTYQTSSCAGWHPVFSNPDNAISPFDARVAGGEAFDLQAVHKQHAKFIRIRDLAVGGTAPPTAGFDLDAIAVVHPPQMP